VILLKATIEISCNEPEIILKSIQPELENAKNFKVNLKALKDKIIVNIESEKISGLLAGINSYLRLVKVAKDSLEI